MSRKKRAHYVGTKLRIGVNLKLEVRKLSFRESVVINNHTVSKIPFQSSKPSSPQESIQNNGGPRRLMSLHDQEESAKRLSTLMFRPNNGKIIYSEADRFKNQNLPRPTPAKSALGVHNSTGNQRNLLSKVIQFSTLSPENRNSNLENEFQKPIKATYLKNVSSSYVFLRKISRRYHPSGSLTYSGSPVGSRLEPVIEQTKGFPYLFSGTENTTIKAGLNND